MNTIVKMAGFALLAMLLLDQSPALAEDSTEAASAAASWGKGLGAGLAAGIATHESNRLLWRAHT